jgi:AraC-like DNA-binding protein
MKVELPGISDPVGSALHGLRMSGTFYCRSEFRAPWALALPAMDDCLMLHVVTEGCCRLELRGQRAIVLKPGELALVPHGQGHVLCSASGLKASNLFDLPRQIVSDRYETLQLGGDGERTVMICGLFQFDDPSARRLIALLPKAFRLETGTGPQADWVQSTLQLIAVEARAMNPGGATIITRLADVLVVNAIRSWLVNADAPDLGWLGALRDPAIGRAITGIHRDPGRDWTLDSLSAEACMSRSAFSARFSELVGEPPMQHLARLRMDVARRRLGDGATVTEVALNLGYRSEAAFSRAFKRFAGHAPSELKRRG